MKNESLTMLQQLRLDGMSNAYEAILQLPINKHPEAHELVARLVDAEKQSRSDKRMKMFLRLSKLRYASNIQDIQCSKKRNLTKEKLAILADCSWMDRGENLVITGATGCGKSYLACALGNHACVEGYRTLYFNMNRFTEQLAQAKTEGTLIKWMDKLKKAKLIIFDDFAIQPITHAVKLILLQILEDRYEKASTIIASQIPVSKWHKYFDEPTIADAILDRLVPKAHRSELKGKSLRTKSKHIS